MESTCPQNKNRTAYLFLTPLPTKQEVFSKNKKEYKILGNCRIDCDENKNFRLTQPGIDGDKYYNLVKTKENGKVKYEVVEAGSYIATAEEIILQPLN